MSAAHTSVAITTIILPIFLATSVAIVYITPAFTLRLYKLVWPLGIVLISSLVIVMVLVSLNLAGQGTAIAFVALSLFDLLGLITIYILRQLRSFLVELALWRVYIEHRSANSPSD